MAALKFVKDDPPMWDFSNRVPTVVEVCLDDDLVWEFNDPPGWLDFELCEVGWYCVFDIHNEAQFALEHGLCGGQTFSILVYPPVYTKDYWGECDVEYNWEMQDVTPLPSKHHLDFWTGWLKS